MKSVTTILFAFAFIFTSISAANAQINLGKLLKDKLGDSSEETTTDDETEIEVDMDADFKPIENKQPVSFRMQTEFFKKGKSKGKSDIMMTMDTWKMAMEIDTEGEEMLMVMDNKKGTMITVTGSGDQRQGFEMKQPKVKIKEGADLNNGDFTVKKTGNTKTINGLKCEEYIVETDDGTTTAWVTKDYGLNYTSMMTPFVSRLKKKPANLENSDIYDMEGIPVESRTISKDGKEETLMYITDVKKDNAIDRSVFNLNDVEIMSLNFGF